MTTRNTVTRRRFVYGSGLGIAAAVLGACSAGGSSSNGPENAHAAGQPANAAGAVRAVWSPPSVGGPANPGWEGWPGLAFIGGGESNKLWVVDARYHALVTAIDVGGPLVERTDPKRYPNLRDAHAMVFTKDFREMFTVDSWQYDQSYAIKLDPRTFREIARAPAGEGGHHAALSPDDRYLYVANQYAPTVSVIDRATMTKLKDLQVGDGADYISPSMYWDGKAIDSPYLFVTADKVPAVVAIDWRRNEVVKSIPLAGSNHGVNLTPDGKQAWVAVGGAKQVAIVDVGKLEVVKTLELIAGGGPVHIVFSPDGRSAYVSHTSPDGVYLLKIDTENHQEVWRSAGSGAHLGCTPDGREVWTLNHTFDQGDRYPYVLGGQPLSAARAFDAATGQWNAEVIFERRPHEIQFVPYAAVETPPQPAAATAVATNGGRRVTITGKNDVYRPASVTAKQGETLQFEIVNQDGYDHLFESKAAKIAPVQVPANRTTVVSWTAGVPPGQYVLDCGFHPGMQLMLMVQ